MKRFFSLFISWVIFLIIALLMFWSVYRISRDPYKPLMDAQIPQKTKDFFAGILGKFGFNIKFVDLFDDKSWSNDNDYGVDSVSGLVNTEDENFVVYFDSANTSEKEKAGFALQKARENIRPLADLFGRYYYAKDLKGRKLPIYITNTEEKFNAIYYKLAGVKTDTKWMAGVCINTVSGTGEILTDGIVLKDFGPSGDPERFRLNLKHEMAHYVHLTSVNWLSTHPMIWETEGFATYFENDKDYFKTLGTDISKNVDHIHLSQDVTNYLDAYWVGYTVLLYISEKYSPQKAKEYIRANYTLNVNSNLQKNLGIGIGPFESGWEQYVHNKH